MAPPHPKRGQVWKVNFDPTIGAEIKKLRPAVVINSDGIGKLPLRLIAPMTAWQEKFEGNIWHIRIEPTGSNGLTKVSAVDVLQIRGADIRRFTAHRGSDSLSNLRPLHPILLDKIKLPGMLNSENPKYVDVYRDPSKWQKFREAVLERANNYKLYTTIGILILILIAAIVF